LNSAMWRATGQKMQSTTWDRVWSLMAQAIVIAAKAMTITNLKEKLPVQEADVTLLPYMDAADASEWSKYSIADCLQAGIVTDRSSGIEPKAYVTRAEMAAIVQRLLEKSELI